MAGTWLSYCLALLRTETEVKIRNFHFFFSPDSASWYRSASVALRLEPSPRPHASANIFKTAHFVRAKTAVEWAESLDLCGQRTDSSKKDMRFQKYQDSCGRGVPKRSPGSRRKKRQNKSIRTKCSFPHILIGSFFLVLATTTTYCIHQPTSRLICAKPAIRIGRGKVTILLPRAGGFHWGFHCSWRDDSKHNC